MRLCHQQIDCSDREPSAHNHNDNGGGMMMAFALLLFGCLKVNSGQRIRDRRTEQGGEYMQRYMSMGIAFFAAFLMSASAQASSDGGCYPEWKLNTDTACSSTIVLMPGNDTRTNMLLLLADRVSPVSNFEYPETNNYEGQGRNFFRWNTLDQALYPKPVEKLDRSRFGGSRCQTYHSGTLLFGDELRAAKIKRKEQGALMAARSSIFAICADPQRGGYSRYYFSEEQKALAKLEWSDPAAQIRSKKGREFLKYLLGAQAFYVGDFKVAHDNFVGLTKSSNDWLKETAIYMIGRTEINRAQASAFGKWGDFEGADAVNKIAVANAEKVFAAYIKNFPKGRYTASAKGLMRRVFWLAGDTKRLAEAYEQLLTQTNSLDPGAFAEEADTKLFFNANVKNDISDPLLLAVISLEQMRKPAYREKIISLAELQQLKGSFSNDPELYDYLLASHAFHVEGDASKVLGLIPDAGRQENFSYLQFSRQALRGMALAQRKDRNEEGFWRDMIAGANQPYQRPFVELGLATSLESKGQVDKVFATDSPVQDQTIREILLQYSVGPGILRRTAGDALRPAHEREVALFTLLYKQLASRDYAGFLQDSKSIPADAESAGYLTMLHADENVPLGLFSKGNIQDDFPCPSLAATAGSLAQNKKQRRARLCLGEFIRLNGFDYFSFGNRLPKDGALGSAGSKFASDKLVRQDIYKDIIADPRANKEDKSYALYRAVYCYARTGNNSCGGKDVALSQRKAWFRRLKNSYPNSKWAKALKYYW